MYPGPPDELNHIQPNGGRHFGFPYCYGKDYADPTYNLNMSCAPYVPAAFELGPHVSHDSRDNMLGCCSWNDFLSWNYVP